MYESSHILLINFNIPELVFYKRISEIILMKYSVGIVDVRSNKFSESGQIIDNCI